MHTIKNWTFLCSKIQCQYLHKNTKYSVTIRFVPFQMIATANTLQHITLILAVIKCFQGRKSKLTPTLKSLSQLQWPEQTYFVWFNITEYHIVSRQLHVSIQLLSLFTPVIHFLGHQSRVESFVTFVYVTIYQSVCLSIPDDVHMLLFLRTHFCNY